MDEDLKLLIGLDIDTKISNIEQIQNEINKNNDVKLNVGISVDTSGTAVNNLRNQFNKALSKISKDYTVDTTVRIKDVIVPKNVASQITSNINKELKENPITITISDANSQIDSAHLKNITDELGKLANVQLKLTGQDEFIAQIDSMTQKVQQLVAQLDLKNAKAAKEKPPAFTISDEELKRNQSYVNLLSQIDGRYLNLSRLANRGRLIDPDLEKSFSVVDANGVRKSLEDVYSNVYTALNRIRDLSNTTRKEFQGIFEGMFTYYQAGGTRSFDQALRNGYTTLEVLQKGIDKINRNGDSKPIISAKGPSEEEVRRLQSFLELLRQINEEFELAQSTSVKFMNAVENVSNIDSSKLENFQKIFAEIVNSHKEFQKVTKEVTDNTVKVQDKEQPTVQSSESANKKTKSSGSGTVLKRLREESIAIGEQINAIKKDLNETNVAAPLLDSIEKKFADTANSIEQHIEKIKEGIASLIASLNSGEVDSRLLDLIKTASSQTTNSTENITQPSNKKRQQIRKPSINLSNADIKFTTNTIAKLEGILNSIGKTGDQTFDTLSTELQDVQKDFISLASSADNNSRSIEEQIEQFGQLTTKLTQIQIAITNYQKSVEKAQTITSRKIESSIDPALYLSETKDISNIRQELQSFDRLQGSNLLSVNIDQLDADDNIKKLTVFAENANGEIEKLKFNLGSIGDGDSKGLVYAGKTLTTLEDQASSATKAIDKLIRKFANANELSYSDGIVSNADGSSNAVYEKLNQQLAALRATASGGLGNGIQTNSDFGRELEKESQEIREQIKLLENRNKRVNALAKNIYTLGQKVTRSSLGQVDNEYLQSAILQLRELEKTDISVFDLQNLEKAEQQIKDIQAAIQNTESERRNAAFLRNRDSTITSLQARMQKLLTSQVQKDPVLYGRWESIFGHINTSFMDTEERMTSVRKEVGALEAEFKSLGVTQSTLAESISAGAKKFTEWFGISQVIMGAVSSVRQMISVSIELDTQLTNLQIASGYTREQTEQLLRSYSDLAQELGSTTSQVSAAADSWLRQGYNIQETNDLITNSMVLSKVGQLDSAEATQYLTSAMKGYNVEASESLEIVDKLSAVDMQAAVSAGGLAEAMSRTASSAQLAGISMNQLIGYATVIGETTQRSMETVGESLRSIFSRMGSIQAGRLEDPETGEDLSNVETSLRNVGIELRDSNSEFRNFADVLEEISGKWDSMSSVQQRAIANSIAGINQYESFVVLIENYGKAMEYATVAAESNGTAMEKFSIYQESAEAKLNRTKAAFESLSSTVADTSVITGALDFFTGLLNVTDSLVDNLGLIPTLLGGISAFATLSGKNAGKLSMPSYWENRVQLIRCRKGA